MLSYFLSHIRCEVKMMWWLWRRRRRRWWKQWRRWISDSLVGTDIRAKRNSLVWH